MLEDPAITALLGVGVGAVLSALTSLFLLRMQRRSQERYEVWIRLLNSYQDFANQARNLLEFDRRSPEWGQARVRAFKAMNDAETLDPHGVDRVKLMRSILEKIGLARDSISRHDAINLSEEIGRVYRDFEGDGRHKYKRYR